MLMYCSLWTSHPGTLLYVYAYYHSLHKSIILCGGSGSMRMHAARDLGVFQLFKVYNNIIG